MRIAYPDSWTQVDRDTLDDMFSEARRTGKWFWCGYQDLWFSPDDLEAEQKASKFIWSAVNWKLRAPQERLAEAQRRTERAKAAEDRIAAKIAR